MRKETGRGRLSSHKCTRVCVTYPPPGVYEPELGRGLDSRALVGSSPSSLDLPSLPFCRCSSPSSNIRSTARGLRLPFARGEGRLDVTARARVVQGAACPARVWRNDRRRGRPARIAPRGPWGNAVMVKDRCMDRRRKFLYRPDLISAILQQEGRSRYRSRSVTRTHADCRGGSFAFYYTSERYRISFDSLLLIFYFSWFPCDSEDEQNRIFFAMYNRMTMSLANKALLWLLLFLFSLSLSSCTSMKCCVIFKCQMYGNVCTYATSDWLKLHVLRERVYITYTYVTTITW